MAPIDFNKQLKIAQATFQKVVSSFWHPDLFIWLKRRSIVIQCTRRGTQRTKLVDALTDALDERAVINWQSDGPIIVKFENGKETEQNASA